ncbi:MAG: hydrolase [Verrucomicrobia bacterium 61-8]|nr:linear amide C-N hydrolase [Verrucomicrobiota bacterium]OJV25086.1 MAG: hydrolase [Verrucomicrobia bacterium 61-8]
MKKLPLLLAACVGLAAQVSPVPACTRAVLKLDDGTVLTGRSMDWMDDIQNNLWAFPRGMKRDGAAGAGSIKWESKYGSVITTIYEIATVDGINEKGLVANTLYLAESDYGAVGDKPAMCISMWAQYVLDNYASVAEAVAALEKEPFRIIAPKLPDGSPATGHLALTDPSGDSAIFEYIDGKLVIHHGPQYTVMTNSPEYSQQLAIEKYWSGVGGTNFLPGTARASDRFARASFGINSVPRGIDKSFINAVPGKDLAVQGVASVMSVIRSVSVPLGLTTPGEPNIASTIWRTVSDSKNLTYYYDAATVPNTFWVDLTKMDFAPGAGVKRLMLTGGKYYAGEVSKQFELAQAFTPLAATTGK